MKKNNILILGIMIICSFSSINAIYTTPVKATVSRSNNYTFEVFTTSPFSFYDITINSEGIMFTDMHNLTTIKVNYLIPGIIETKMIYEFLIVTYNNERYQIENVTFEFIIAAGLTDDELWAMWEKYRQVEEKIEEINQTFEDWKNNYTGLPEEENAWDKYGGGFATAGITAAFVLSFGVTPIFLPMLAYFKRKQRKAERKEKAEVEERHKIERNMKSSDLYMNPQIEEDDGKRKRYYDLLNDYEYICVKKLDRNLDLSYFLRPETEEIFDTTSKSNRPHTSLDVLKNRLETDEYTRDNPLRKKHIVMAVIKNLYHRKWFNGTSKDPRERNAFPINCNIEQIEDYALIIHEDKEAWLTGAPGNEAMEYEKMNKDLYDDYEEVTISQHTDRATGKKIVEYKQFIKNIKSKM